ncbi:dipeptidase PepV [Clostridium sediminicola]|uniref:dipeptidase PepV n=1 Tax=Clostridium sediminicola TaxID=3114879 RepID=UPI0031F1F098
MEFHGIIEKYRREIIKSVQELVRIKSVSEESKDGYPFGEGPYNALKYVLDLGNDLGFITENVDNYAGHIEFGQGKEIIGILAHLDVVPEGEGWTYPPYGAEIYENKIYGRGTSDDKGPAIAALYAMKAVMDSGLEINKRIRLILGTSEETSSEDIKYYLSKKETPNLAFSPDAEFPVIQGEMGILEIKLMKKFKNTTKNNIRIKSISGGSAANMVPGICTAILDVYEIEKEKIKKIVDEFNSSQKGEILLEEDSDEMKIISNGISAHGGSPEKGKNAISQMMMLLEELDIASSDLQEFIATYNSKIGMEYNGQSIGCGFEDDISGKLKLNIGIINFNKDLAEIILNVRYPITIKAEKVIDNMRKELDKADIEVIVKNDMKPIYMDEEHVLIQKLMKAYKKVTKDSEAKPKVIAGGTYARAMSNAVAFGAQFPGEPDCAHQKDEYIEIDNLIKCTNIFAQSIYELTMNAD